MNNIMEKKEILELLIDWNFWTKEQFTGTLRSELLTEIERKSRAKEIMIITGARRTGKSTIILQYLKNKIDAGIAKENILIINFEDPRFRDLNLELLNRIYELYLTEIQTNSGEQYVVLDEVQVIDGWEKFARYLHENRRVHVFVTGSSSKLLSSEYSTVLAGRHMDTQVYPLSFKEHLGFRGISINSDLEMMAQRHTIKKELKEYITMGGFPKVTLEEEERNKKELLYTYYRDILIKDVTVRYNIKDIQKLEELAKYYMTNISSQNSYNRIKNIFGMSLDTVERYSSYLESTYMLFFIKKYSYSLKEQVLNPRKVYALDTGLRNTVSFSFSQDYGRLVENLVFIHLRREYSDIYYWKNETQKEVDFIICEKNKVTRAIQVCWDMDNENTRKREIDGLIAAMEAHNIKEGLILTDEMEEEIEAHGKIISVRPIWKWLLTR
ncbi:MAG: ATP-binding protein [Methanolobus sp.]|nr:ATP-binding protein [Methanolobus sp.]